MPLTTAVPGYGFSLDLINTLHIPVDRGTQNSTVLPKPSSCTSSVALQYSGSAIDLDDLFPRLKALKDTTGLRTQRMFSFNVSIVGCLMVLSQTGFVASFKNCEKKVIKYKRNGLFWKVGVSL